jgi:hypothetical protein
LECIMQEVTHGHPITRYSKFAKSLERLLKCVSFRRPNTTQYRHLVIKRAKHLAEITDREQKWNGWLNLAKQILVPNLTETGFRVVQGPNEMHRQLSERHVVPQCCSRLS